jgi:hypothetical protein
MWLRLLPLVLLDWQRFTPSPRAECDLQEHRLRRLGEHELTGPQGYWFVEPRERGVQDATHSAVMAL